MTAVDADRIVGIAHDAAKRSLFGNGFLHATRDIAIYCTSVHCAILFAVPIEEQIAAQHTHIEGLDFFSSQAEVNFATFDIEIADETTRGSKQAIAKLTLLATFWPHYQAGDGLAVAIEIALEGIAMVDADGYPQGVHIVYLVVLQIDVGSQLEELALIGIMTHVDLVCQLGQVVGLANLVRIAQCSATLETTIVVLELVLPYRLPIVTSRTMRLRRHLHLGR